MLSIKAQLYDYESEEMDWGKKSILAHKLNPGPS